MARKGVEAFLTYLAGGAPGAVSTRRLTLSALLFLYRKVLELQLPWMTEIGQPAPQLSLPVVLKLHKGQ